MAESETLGADGLGPQGEKDWLELTKFKWERGTSECKVQKKTAQSQAERWKVG